MNQKTILSILKLLGVEEYPKCICGLKLTVLEIIGAKKPSILLKAQEISRYRNGVTIIRYVIYDLRTHKVVHVLFYPATISDAIEEWNNYIENN